MEATGDWVCAVSGTKGVLWSEWEGSGDTWEWSTSSGDKCGSDLEERGEAISQERGGGEGMGATSTFIFMSYMDMFLKYAIRGAWVA